MCIRDRATEAPDSLQRETADGLALEGLLGTEAPEEGLVERIALREAVDPVSYTHLDVYKRQGLHPLEGQLHPHPGEAEKRQAGPADPASSAPCQ